MRKFTNINLKKEIRKYYVFLITGILFMILGLLCGVWRLIEIDKIDKKITDFNTIINKRDDKDRILKKAYLDVKSIPLEFAYYNNEKESFYIVSDGSYLYITYMSNSDFEKLNKDSIYDNAIRVKGVTGKVNDEIKKTAIDAYNKKVESEADKLTVDDYDSYFGNIYLDMTVSNTDLTRAQTYLFLGFILCGGVILVISILKLVHFNDKIKNLSDDEIKKIDDEINSDKSIYYDRLKLYLTDNYIVSFSNKIKVLKYDDLIWIYPIVQKKNGVNSSQSIKSVSKNGDTNLIATINVSLKVNMDIFDQIWKEIIAKNPNVLVGYTKDNISKVRDMVAGKTVDESSNYVVEEKKDNADSETQVSVLNIEESSDNKEETLEDLLK